MQRLSWNLEKNRQLQESRGISFEEVALYIDQGEIVDVIDHPNPDQYPNQRMFVLNIDDYIYLVPFVESPEEIFLKTIIPSRKATKTYLGGEP